MALLINARNLAKTYGAVPLFQDLSFTIAEGDRIGLIGPNGSGKSTLLEILAGGIQPDAGEVAVRKQTRLGYVPQDSQFAAGQTVEFLIREAAQNSAVPAGEREGVIRETLGQAGFEDFGLEAASLSGGWRKRLAIAQALARKPDLLLLDEPTNHLDLAGIEWLEALVAAAPFASVVVSHDRYFLENTATTMLELNRCYPGGILRVAGNYSTFLENKAAFLHAQTKRQEAVENRVRREMEWLRRGAKARTRKSKARIGKARELMEELADLNARGHTATAAIDFTATGRKTRRLLHLDAVGFEIGGRTLFEDLDFALTAGARVGLVGANGSGKTTLLRLLEGGLKPSRGEIERAEGLRVVYFAQNRQFDADLTLRRALAPEGDSVLYQDRVIHVAGWAARFLFSSEQLDQPVGRLSGGEQARVSIARLMLEPADVLLLDEPTNDLDIPTLEILEESLVEFRGALVLVAHDRYLLDRVATVVVGLDGEGTAERFADYGQWEEWLRGRKQPKAKSGSAAAPKSAPAAKKLSYLEAREYASIEQRIAEAERALVAKQAELEAPEVVIDGRRLQQTYRDVLEAQGAVDDLYARWAELEEKKLQAEKPDGAP